MRIGDEDQCVVVEVASDNGEVTVRPGKARALGPAKRGGARD